MKHLRGWKDELWPESAISRECWGMACKAWPESTISHERRGMAQLHRTRTKYEAPLWTFRNMGGGVNILETTVRGWSGGFYTHALILFNSRPPSLPPPQLPPHQLPPLPPQLPPLRPLPLPLQLPPPLLPPPLLPPPLPSPIPQQSAVGSNRSDCSDCSDCYELGGVTEKDAPTW